MRNGCGGYGSGSRVTDRTGREQVEEGYHYRRECYYSRMNKAQEEGGDGGGG